MSKLNNPYPQITIEYVGAACQLAALLLNITLIAIRAVDVVKTRNVTQMRALIIIGLGTISQASLSVRIFTNIAYVEFDMLCNITASIASLLYILFQVGIFERFRIFASINVRWTQALYCLTLAVFLATQPLILIGYTSVNTDVNSFIYKWLAISAAWYAYIGILDVILNCYLLRLFFNSGLLSNGSSNSSNPKQSRTKVILVSFLIGAFVIDVLGVTALTTAHGTFDSEATIRYSRGWKFIAGAVFSLHVQIGLSYLTLLASLKAPSVSSKTRAKSAALPLKKAEMSPNELTTSPSQFISYQ